MCFSQGISDGGDIDTARSKVHNALKYVDTYKPIWYIYINNYIVICIILTI